MNNQNADYWINTLRLKKHPEGGYYREYYRSKVIIDQKSLPVDFRGSRSVATSIYFLLKGEDISHLHRIKSDEIWHFYQGSSATIHCIESSGTYTPLLLGANVNNNESFQHVIPAGSWFGAEVNDKTGYALVGCTVSPGFDFEDFEIAHKKKLLQDYPHLKTLINQFSLD